MWTSLLSSRAAIDGLFVISLTSSQKYEVATPARLESTMIVAITRPQPHIQPIRGPKALTVQVKEVPQSGMALLSSR